MKYIGEDVIVKKELKTRLEKGFEEDEEGGVIALWRCFDGVPTKIMLDDDLRRAINSSRKMSKMKKEK